MLSILLTCHIAVGSGAWEDGSERLSTTVVKTSTLHCKLFKTQERVPKRVRTFCSRHAMRSVSYSKAFCKIGTRAERVPYAYRTRSRILRVRAFAAGVLRYAYLRSAACHTGRSVSCWFVSGTFI